LLWERTKRESSDPYYDLTGDFDLIIASFQSQYGIRLSKELPSGMKWGEFRDLLVGLGPDTALGRIVSIRAEEDKEVLKHFTKEQKRIRDEWRNRRAKKTSMDDMMHMLNSLLGAFVNMAGGVKN
jgi:hypothetical protein